MELREDRALHPRIPANLTHADLLPPLSTSRNGLDSTDATNCEKNASGLQYLHQGRNAMLTVQSRKPDPHLRTFVRSYVQRETQRDDQETVEPVVARLGTMLEFQFARPYEIPIYGTAQILVSPRIAVIGPITHRRARLVIRDQVQALAVLFQPQGFRALFGIPTTLVTDVGVDANAVLGGNIIELHERLANTAEFNHRVKLLDDFLLKRLMASKPLDEIHRALNRLIMSGSSIRIADIARHAGVTIRQLERKSLEYTGLSPKTLVRIARFQQVLKMKRASSLTWAEIAHALEYHDQMHMIRDFRTFAGDAPVRACDKIRSDHLISF
jgi:AraC-like DNA-binding protein